MYLSMMSKRTVEHGVCPMPHTIALYEFLRKYGRRTASYVSVSNLPQLYAKMADLRPRLSAILDFAGYQFFGKTSYGRA